jgi:hypothetical protein
MTRSGVDLWPPMSCATWVSDRAIHCPGCRTSRSLGWIIWCSNYAVLKVHPHGADAIFTPAAWDLR